MGSVPSTPNSERTDDPWWPIENQNLTLNHIPLLSAMDEEGQHSNLVTNNRTADDALTDDSQPTVDCEIMINVENSENVREPTNRSSASDGQQSGQSPTSASIIDDTTAEKRRREMREAKITQSVEEFKEEIRAKREKRQGFITDLRDEITSLRKQLAAEKELSQQLMDDRIATNIAQCLQSEDGGDAEDDDNNRTTQSKHIALRSELAEAQFSLQIANAEVLTVSTELTATRKQVSSLKEVISVSKQMVKIREDQLDQVSLKNFEENAQRVKKKTK